MPLPRCSLGTPRPVRGWHPSRMHGPTLSLRRQQTPIRTILWTRWPIFSRKVGVTRNSETETQVRRWVNAKCPPLRGRDPGEMVQSSSRGNLSLEYRLHTGDKCRIRVKSPASPVVTAEGVALGDTHTGVFKGKGAGRGQFTLR